MWNIAYFYRQTVVSCVGVNYPILFPLFLIKKKINTRHSDGS